MEKLTYEDYKDRVDMRDLLEHAGYHFHRKEGIRYPVFVRLDDSGHRIKGDKFIVTANGKCCFKPPEQRNYNVISFIKEHPSLFPEYRYGMDNDHLVNLVCRQLLGQPEEAQWVQIRGTMPDVRFDLSDYDIVRLDPKDPDNMKLFYPYFRQRGIDPMTQRAFAEDIWLSTNLRRSDGRRFTNIAFPFRAPLGSEVIGLEVRSVRKTDGSSFKGKALGTDSVNGMWIASPNHTPLASARDVLWFESAYDAMSYHQIVRKNVFEEKETLGRELSDGTIDKRQFSERSRELDAVLDRFMDAVYLSTGGSPSDQQFKGILRHTPEARHLLCFDNDKAGRMYCMNFLMHRENRYFNSYTTPEGSLAFIDRTKAGQSDRYDFNPNNVTLGEFCQRLGLTPDNVIRMAPSRGYKDWNDQLLDHRQEEAESVSDEREEEYIRGIHR